MRGGEINSLFKVSGTSNICQKICDEGMLKDYLDEQDIAKVGGQVLQKLEEFFERRNRIAHSLNAAASAGPETVSDDFRFFESLAADLSCWLDKSISQVSAPTVVATIELPKTDVQEGGFGNYIRSWLSRLFQN